METFNWKKQLFEVIVLIAGILITFGLNNWWSQRKEAITLQKHYINRLYSKMGCIGIN